MTISLHHIHGSLKGSSQDFDLAEGGSVICGRLPASDIAFDPLQDIKASGRHARIFKQGAHYLLEDLRSSNGTFVNGFRLQTSPVILNAEDIIEFGGGGPRARVTFSASVLADTASIDIGASQTLPHASPVTAQPVSAPFPVSGARKAPQTPVDASALTVEATSPDDQDDPAAATLPELPPQPVLAPLQPLLIPAQPGKQSVVGASTVALMIGKAQREGSRRIMTLLMVLVSIMMLTILVLTIFVVRSKQTESHVTEAQRALDETQSTLRDAQNILIQTQDELNRAQAKLRDLAAQKQRDDDERRALEARLDAASRAHQQNTSDLQAMRVEIDEKMREHFRAQQQQMEAMQREASAEIAPLYGEAIFLLIYESDPPSKPAEGFCTAFAVHPDGWLATSAHCIETLLTLRADAAQRQATARFYARRNGAPSQNIPLDLDHLYTHPRYTHAASPDVGLLKLSLPASTHLSPTAALALPAEVQTLHWGDPVYVLGFPSHVANPQQAQAHFRGGFIANLTDFNQRTSTPPLQHWVWHTALTSKESQGAPIFDRKGRVVAINSGTIGVERVVTGDGQSQRVQTIYSAEALNFGVRIDLLHDLTTRHNIDLPRPTATPP